MRHTKLSSSSVSSSEDGGDLGCLWAAPWVEEVSFADLWPLTASWIKKKKYIPNKLLFISAMNSQQSKAMFTLGVFFD